MPRIATLTRAFASFGAVPRNPRWSWSAISADGKTVVLTLWEDEIAPDGSVDFFGHPRLSRWQTQIGHRFRTHDLRHAGDECGGLFRVIHLRAVREDAVPRQISERRADPDTMMRLTRLCERTGEFAAEPVRPA